MNALAFDFDYGDEVAPPASEPVRRLYAVRGTVDAPAAPATALPSLDAARTPFASAAVAPAATPTLDAVLAPARPAARGVGATPTLDLILGGAFTALRRSEPVGCPICESGRITPRWSAASGVVGGRCADCGTTIE